MYAITNEVLEPITFVLAYPTVFVLKCRRVSCSEVLLLWQPPTVLKFHLFSWFAESELRFTVIYCWELNTKSLFTFRNGSPLSPYRFCHMCVHR